MEKVEISTSILNVEREQASKIIYGLEVAHTDYFHIDVMDGKFVPKDTVKQMLDYTTLVKQITNTPIDVHLMVEDVKEYINEYIGFEPNIITFHLEAAKNKEEVKALISMIKEAGIKVRNISKTKYKNRRNIRILAIYSYVPSNDSRARTRRTKTNTRNIRESQKIKNIYRRE